MNIADLAGKLATQFELPKGKVKLVLEGAMDTITKTAIAGEEVTLSGFGKFKIQQRPEREGRNPATGETVKLAASKVLKFQPAKAVKDQLNGAA